MDSELTAGYRLKDHITGGWEDCVVYTRYNAKPYDKGCIRFRYDFMAKFEPVDMKNDIPSYSVED